LLPFFLASRLLLAVTAVACVLLPGRLATDLAKAQPTVSRVVEHFAPVRGRPDATAPVLWRLYEGTQVSVTGNAVETGGDLWLPIILWNSHVGWVALAAISFDPYPAPSPPPSSTGPRPPRPPRLSREPQPLTATGTIIERASLAETPDGNISMGSAPAGTRVRVDAWTVAGDDRARYHVIADEVAGWTAPTAVALDAVDPVSHRLGDRSIVDPLRGKGMWFVLDSREHGPDAGRLVAAAARDAGLTHLYVEVATSRGGFFGDRWLDELLPAAQAAGVKVVGSVYVWLDDLATDLDLALTVARYRTPGGHALDGLTADIEETLVADNVQAFGDLLRHHLGDDYLLIATTYPPGSFAAPRYPWAALARSWNAIAPMAYWSQMRGRALTPDEAYAYTADSVAGIRRLTGRSDIHVDLLGQLFELGRPLLLGPDPPTQAEVEAAMRAARDAGAIGISFFDWTRATPAHWEALAAFVW
jgi:hypothetical protein